MMNAEDPSENSATGVSPEDEEIARLTKDLEKVGCVQWFFGVIACLFVSLFYFGVPVLLSVSCVTTRKG